MKSIEDDAFNIVEIYGFVISVPGSGAVTSPTTKPVSPKLKNIIIDFDEVNKLETLGEKCFNSVNSVSFKIPPLKLNSLGNNAFQSSGKITDTINLNYGEGTCEITSFPESCFSNYKGRILISGNYSHLEEIKEYSFYNCGNTQSKIEIIGKDDTYKLNNINSNSFTGYKGLLKLYGYFKQIVFPTSSSKVKL